MIRRSLNAAAALAFAAAALGAQAGKAPPKAAEKAAAPPAAVTIPAAAIGTWDSKAMTGPKDSVIATNTTMIAADGKVSIMLPNRPTIQGRVLAAGGDSVVVEAGPYESIVKKGLQVTTRTTTHYKGDVATGTLNAKYSDGSTLLGKSVGTRKAAAMKAPAKKP